MLPIQVPDVNGVYKIGTGVSAPKLISSVEPQFSEKARKKKLSGSCTLSIVVDAKGNVTDVRVIHSVAEDQPVKMRSAALSLDEEAVKAVRQYHFEPGTFEGRVVSVATTVEVSFRIF